MERRFFRLHNAGEIFLKGNGIEFFWKDLLTLGAIAVTLMTVSLLNFKRFVSK